MVSCLWPQEELMVNWLFAFVEVIIAFLKTILKLGLE